MSIIKVTVTAEDIANGCRYKARRCPTARALERALGERVSVGPVLLADGEVWRAVLLDRPGAFVVLPNVCVVQINAFDDGRLMSPFEFEIEVKDNN